LGEGGTCASLPGVYAAVGRRLGYPLRPTNATDPSGERLLALSQDAAGEYLKWLRGEEGIVSKAGFKGLGLKGVSYVKLRDGTRLFTYTDKGEIERAVGQVPYSFDSDMLKALISPTEHIVITFVRTFGGVAQKRVA
jgi:hypothetical protein